MSKMVTQISKSVLDKLPKSFLKKFGITKKKVKPSDLTPKMEAEIKAMNLSKGQSKVLKSKDTPTIKKLEQVKKNIGDDQIGKKNRLFSEKAEGNIKGKLAQKRATILSKDTDKAIETINDLFPKMKSGKYSQTEYREFISAQGKVSTQMGKGKDTDISVSKTKLTFKPENPSDKIKSDTVSGNIAAEVKRLKSIKQKKTLANVKKEMTPEQKKAANEFKKKLKLKKEKEELGFNMGGLTKPTANQTGLKKLPTTVRNKMGYMYGGGMAKKKKMGNIDYRKGGLVIMIGQAKPIKKGKK
jgi:hypothetical protein